jgi:hypothetical protein
MLLQGSLSIERMCGLARVSRASFYRFLREQRPVEEEMEVRSAIQQIALGHRRRYGYRRISAELRRRGMPVNHKRVLRIIREDNLLAVPPRRFVITTNSNHQLEIYLNLASRMKLTGIDQLWVADITYIRLKAEIVYLAVILDGFSRKVVGWALDRTLVSRLAIAALERAAAKRRPPPGLVHHSDRGVQYACAEYVALLEQHRMIPSMSGGMRISQQDAKPALKTYTLRKRKEAFDWINELTMTLIQVWAVHTQHQAETARRLAVETWLQRNGVITITQNKKVLPIFPEQFAHN